MIRIVPSLALVAAFNVTSAPSQGTELDLRCTNVDRALSERLRGVLPHQAQASPAEVNRVMARMASARLDCKQGRTERGLRTYADAEATLRSLEETVAVKLAPTRETASGDWAAQ
jgi:hypothetical protein